jgi:hypothetical protein
LSAFPDIADAPIARARAIDDGPRRVGRVVVHHHELELRRGWIVLPEHVVDCGRKQVRPVIGDDHG